jgi:glycosyltransferase involved in cell wall biosynthesis
MASMARGRRKSPPVVRNCYDPEGPKSDIRSRVLYDRCTDGLIVISREAKDRAIRKYGFDLDAVQVAEPGIDLIRFSRDRKISGSREDFGLKKDDFAVGVVSRIRETRRIDVVLEAVRILVEEFPQLRLLLVGRGRPGALDTVVRKPVMKMGIADRVLLAGYCRNDQLVAAYRAMDVLVYPVPGTDKTCRTVREAMASGVPVIATRMGFLPELIEDGVNGRLMDLAGHHLAEILSDMIRDQDKVAKMAHLAHHKAQQRFSTASQAEKTLSFYGRLMAGGANRSAIQ